MQDKRVPDFVFTKAVEITIAAVANQKDALYYPDKVTALIEAVTDKLNQIYRVGREG